MLNEDNQLLQKLKADDFLEYIVDIALEKKKDNTIREDELILYKSIIKVLRQRDFKNKNYQKLSKKKKKKFRNRVEKIFRKEKHS